MSREYDFIKECGLFFVLTMNDGVPAGRPFGAIMEQGKSLYFSTANTKDVYAQLKKNPKIQIIAMKPGTRDWIRINGRVEECEKFEEKQTMLEVCPNLNQRFDSAFCPQFALFKMDDVKAEFHIDGGKMA